MSFVFRFLLLFVLAWLVARAFWRLVAGIIVGASVPPPSPSRRARGVPDRGVQMVRDPVCGTFLPPAGALALTRRGGEVVYFCSETCRDRYHEQGGGRPRPSGR
jgi:YHS domain-containing protein